MGRVYRQWTGNSDSTLFEYPHLEVDKHASDSTHLANATPAGNSKPPAIAFSPHTRNQQSFDIKLFDRTDFLLSHTINRRQTALKIGIHRLVLLVSLLGEIFQPREVLRFPTNIALGLFVCVRLFRFRFSSGACGLGSGDG